MATIRGITVERAEEIEDATVVSGSVDPTSGHLILVTKGGTSIDAGKVVPEIKGQPVKVTMNASGDFTKATYPGATRFKFELWGGGGGGSGSNATSGGAGGGGGGYNSVEIAAADLPDLVTLLIGAGGTASPGRSDAFLFTGSPGGSTTIRGLYSAVSFFRDFGVGGGGSGIAATRQNGTGGFVLIGGAGGGTKATGYPGETAVASVSGNTPNIGNTSTPGGEGHLRGGLGGIISDPTYSPATRTPVGGYYAGAGGGGRFEAADNFAGNFTPYSNFDGSGAVYGGGGGGHGLNPVTAAQPGGVSRFGGNGGNGGSGGAGSPGLAPGGGGGGGSNGQNGFAGGAGGAGRAVITVYYGY